MTRKLGNMGVKDRRKRRGRKGMEERMGKGRKKESGRK